MYNQFYLQEQCSLLLNSLDIDQLVSARDELSFRLIEELVLNERLLRKMIDPPKSLKTNSGDGSNGVQEKSNSKSLCKMNDLPKQPIQLSDDAPISSLMHQRSSPTDTKNIPKNYGKAILSFIKRSPLSRRLAAEMNVSFSDLLINIRRLKKRVNSIETLRKMWGSEDLNHKVKKCIRILSYIFMRKHCLPYIFHSKIRHYQIHIKYRNKLIQGIQNPIQFNHLKDY